MRNERSAEGEPSGRLDRSPHPRRLRVRSLLLLVVLLPTAGMLVVAAASASTAVSQRREAGRLQDEARDLTAIVDARAAAARESTQSAVITVAADLGVGIDELGDLYGVDFRAEQAAARTGVDSDTTIQSLPDLGAALARLVRLRASIDAGTASFADAQDVFDELITKLDAVWRRRFERLEDGLSAEAIPGLVHARLDIVHASFDALSWGDRRASLTIRQLRIGEDPDQVGQLLSAQGRYDAALESLDRSGPEVTAALATLRDSAAARRFDATLRDVAADLLAGRPSPLAADPAAFGDAFIDGAPWSGLLTDMVQAAAIDLETEAANQSRDATRDLQTQLGTAGILTVLAVASALLLARSVTRPIRRLEGAAHQIHEGRFDLEPIEGGGPRELADTAAAFNEMAFTLAAVEAHAVALADDPDAPILNSQLPGRTGRALQVALNRLRSSIRRGEQQRRELEQAATHDGLTGLLNRRAAFAMLEHDLARAERGHHPMMALFIDLDGLKAINDAHGHAAGDDALRLTADALQATTRQSDVVARLGGDEFLVAGMATDGPDEAKALAERIRQAVAGQELACADGPVALHCSVGVALTGEGDTVATLVKNADTALYAAKRDGRDRVAWHDDTHTAER